MKNHTQRRTYMWTSFFWGLLSYLSAVTLYLTIGTGDFGMLQFIVGIPVMWLPHSLDQHVWVEYAVLGFFVSTFFITGVRILLTKWKVSIHDCAPYVIAPLLFLIGLWCSLFIIFEAGTPYRRSISAVHPSRKRVSVETRVRGFLHGIHYHAVMVQPGLNRQIGRISNPRDRMWDTFPEMSREDFLRVEFTWSADGKRLVATRYMWYVTAWDFDSGVQWSSWVDSMEEIKESHLRFERFLEFGTPVRERVGDVDVYMPKRSF